jgi:hypothetical protein
LRFYTANDAVERDPANYVLEGSNDGINWSLISSNALFLPDTRNDTGLEIDPTTQALSQVRFSNTTAYAKYRVSFTHVKDDAAANAMQIGEVELLGNVDTSGFPFFSGEPASVSAFEGGPVSLTATASGVPNPSLRWYRSTTGTNFVLLK